MKYHPAKFYYDEPTWTAYRHGVTSSPLADNSVSIGSGNSDLVFSDQAFSIIIGDAKCTNGSIIYNTETGKFNFCEDGIWVEK